MRIHKNLAALCVLLTLLLLCPALPVRAHSVFVFAWAEADRICSESYFAKKRAVREGRITVHNSAGATIASGATDEGGQWCFSAPPAQDLFFVLNAGQGHRAKFHLPASEFASKDARGGTKALPEAAAGAVSASPPPAGQNMETQSAKIELETMIRTAVREEVHSQLGPIRRALAEREADTTPGLRDIIGGLGWILGLAGLAAWYTSKKTASTL